MGQAKVIEPCSAAELLKVGNAAAVIISQRPEHHEHAGKAAVPVEGLLHVRNLTAPPPTSNLSTTARRSNNWWRWREEQEADIDVVGSARERNLSFGGRRVRAVPAVVASHLEQLLGDDAEGPHDMVKPAEAAAPRALKAASRMEARERKGATEQSRAERVMWRERRRWRRRE